MTHKDLTSKSRTKDKHKAKNVSERIENNQSSSLPASAFSLKKFIALPKGLRVKSTGDTPDNSSPRRPAPVKAVPGLTLSNSDYTQQIGVSTVHTSNQAEPVIDNSPISQRRGRSRRGSIQSSTGSAGNGSVSSIPSEGSYTPRYKKRSSSTPPDIGRHRSSPVDRRIGKVVNQYYSNLYNSVNNNGNFSNLNYNGVGNLNWPSASSYSSDLATDVGNNIIEYYDDSDDNFSLDSRTSDVTEVLNNWELNSHYSHKSHTNSASNFQDDTDIAPGSNSIMHPHYLTLPRGGGQQVVQTRSHTQGHYITTDRQRMAYVNGTLPRGGGGTLVYKPTHSTDVIMMGNYDPQVGQVPGNNNHPFIEGRQIHSAGSLSQSKVLSSSMPTLLDGKSKADKKFLKDLKKREKEERKRREKEEKKRVKEEKKIQKALKKGHTRTLPRNWAYVNKPIESVYARPRLSFSAVPIDYDESAVYKSSPAPEKPPPPPPPQPSYKTRALYSSAPDLLRLEQVYGATIRGVPTGFVNYAVPNGGITTNGVSTHSSHHEARTVVLQRGKEGYGFVLRGAKSSSNATGELDFCPTAEFPALQYLDSVDPGSRSDRAGLKSGDFLLEINGENVVRATHDRVVQIIRQSGDTLKLKVVTVKPHSGQENWSTHNDGSMTLPSRGGKRQAPQPPKRDPQTSISLTKSQGKQIAEGMAELDTVQESPLPKTDPIPTGSTKTQQVDLSQSDSGSGTQVNQTDSRGLPKLGLDNVGPSQQVEPIYAKPLKRRLTHNKSFRAPLPPATDQNLKPNKKSIKVPPVTDQLDKALDEYDLQGEVTQEQKTASIRSRSSAKRVSLVDVSSLEGEQGQDKYMSPSEIRIKKYHHSKKQNGAVNVIERSKSTSDLLDGKKSEPVYATPVAVPGKATSKHQRSASGSGDITDKYDYDLSDNVSLKSSASYGGSSGKLASPTVERPKAPPPPPPGGTLPRRQAPPPPKGVEPILAAKTELVSISTNRKSTTIYATPTNVVPDSSTKTQDDSDYESSFRPGNSAKLSDEPKIKTKSLEEVKLKSHQRNASASSRRSEISETSQLSEGSDKPSVSFAEDKVFDNAKSFLQKHPNAQLLVTADIHTSKQHSEPAPDYDISDEDSPKSPSGVTVISIGDRKQSTNASKHYTVRHSDIPESPQIKDTENKKEVVIPPPPSERAPKPPVTKTVHSVSPVSRPTPTSEEIKVTMVSKEREVDSKVEPEVVPPAPAPPPPPPPPVVPIEENKTPVIVRKTPEPQGNIVIPTGDIMAAVQKRQSRLQTEDLKITPVPERKIQIDTQAALLAAVAKRRTALLKKSETAVVDEIEQRLNKSKKLQAAKYTFSSENMKKESKPETKAVEEQKSKAPLKISPKTEVKTSVEKDVTSTSSKTVTSTMKPIFNSTSSNTTVSSKTTTAKMTVTSTASKTPVENKDILTTSKTQVESKDKVEEKEPVKVKSSLSSDKLSGQQQSAKDRVKDFLAEAEKAREEWLKKRSSTSSLRQNSSENLNSVTVKSDTSQSTTTVNGSRKISAPPASTKKFPAPAPNANSRSTSVSSKTTAPIFTSEKIVINTKTVDKAKVNGVERTPSSVTQPVQKKSDTLGIEPVKGRDTELTTNKTSIKDRIANFEKNNKSGIVNGRGRSTSPMSPRYPIHGVTTDSSATDVKKNSTLPPPPGFGDMVQVDIIPPPTSFQPQQDHDAASVVSSLSTLSTLSDEHADSGYSPSKHSYEEVIPPPPPGFDDSNDLGYDEIPTVIPPPPIFDSNENNNKVIKTSMGLSNVNKPFSSKSVDTWQCLDVLDWLDSLNMPQYKTSFQKHCIDGKKLVGLSRNDYIELGVTQVGHRMNLERCIKKATIQKS